MIKNLIAAAAAVIVIAPQAHAQANNFEGFSVAAGVTSVTSSYTGTNGAFYASGGATDYNASAQGQYAFALGDRFVLALGAGLIGNVKADGGSGQIENMTQVYIAPGVTVSQNVLVYGKISSVSYTFNNTNGSYSDTGTGLGLGVQWLFNKNISLQAEYLTVKPADANFNGWTIQSGNNNTSSLSVGYKF